MSVIIHKAYSQRPRKASPAGSRYRDDFTLTIDERGNKKLVHKQTVDQYALIQSFKDECDINLIVSRCAATGDYSLLNKVQGFYGDVTQLPGNLAEMYKVMRNAEQIYAGLPHNIASQFGSMEEFLDVFSSADKFNEFIAKNSKTSENPSKTPSETIKPEDSKTTKEVTNNA